MAKIDAQSFEFLANRLGIRAAGEVLLLALARVCGDNADLWNQARLLGIPWQSKNWTALSKLQKQYNGGVETEPLPALLECEKTAPEDDIGPYAYRAGLETAVYLFGTPLRGIADLPVSICL